MPSRTVKLDKPVALHPGQLATTEIIVREPTGGEFLDFGEPRIYSRTKVGAFFGVEDKEVIASYLNTCIVNDGGSHLLRLLTVKDIRAVKAALFLFFDGEATTTET